MNIVDETLARMNRKESKVKEMEKENREHKESVLNFGFETNILKKCYKNAK